jgi:hypothetical protein
MRKAGPRAEDIPFSHPLEPLTRRPHREPSALGDTGALVPARPGRRCGR